MSAKHRLLPDATVHSSIGAFEPDADMSEYTMSSDDQLMPRRQRAMVVEDELFVAWHIEGLLQEADFEVCAIASSGMEAVETAHKVCPDVVVMDINLGDGIDGIEAARRIRELCDATVVFVTAYGDMNTLQRVQDTVPGAEVLAKPTSAAKLRTAIERPTSKPN
jgi:CheY-like chemotaxis protein